jgi:Acetyltransferase (GNAT) family
MKIHISHNSDDQPGFRKEARDLILSRCRNVLLHLPWSTPHIIAKYDEYISEQLAIMNSFDWSFIFIKNTSERVIAALKFEKVVPQHVTNYLLHDIGVLPNYTGRWNAKALLRKYLELETTIPKVCSIHDDNQSSKSLHEKIWFKYVFPVSWNEELPISWWRYDGIK